MEQPLLETNQSFKQDIKGLQDVDKKEENKESQTQMKIDMVILLKINYFKAALSIIFLTVSVIGLLLLKYFVKLRVYAFYSILENNNIKKATHAFISSKRTSSQISKVNKVDIESQTKYVFQFKRLRYEWQPQKYQYYILSYQKQLIKNSQTILSKSGLTSSQINYHRSLYGLNKHEVNPPTYLNFIFDLMTQPFSIFQYFLTVVYFIEGLIQFGITLIFFTILTATINYSILRKSYKKIKQTAQKQFQVKVKRCESQQEFNISNFDLVPGDIYVPCDQIPCDSIVIQGQLFVNEANLTGQSIPIAKSHLTDIYKIKDKIHWVYEGSKLQTMKNNTLLIAMNTGFSSCKGKILRKMLNPSVEWSDLLKRLLLFQMEVLVVGWILYIISFIRMGQFQIDNTLKILRFFDFMPYTFPPIMPIIINTCYFFSLLRLLLKQIRGTKPQKAAEGARLRTICFDKTGTLTEKQVNFENVYFLNESNQLELLSSQSSKSELINKIFACCNSVETINNQIKGDQIDLSLFLHSKGQIIHNDSSEVIRSVKVNDCVLQIIQIHQFQSEFQSMSVIVRDTSTDQYTIFAKGNPDLIHNHSCQKCPNFNKFMRSLSLNGHRSIAFGLKHISKQQVDHYCQVNRKQHLINLNMLGVVTFANKLKQDAKSTIDTLENVGINTKIITGDDIFLGVKVAYMAGVIPSSKKTIIIEGHQHRLINRSIKATIISSVEGELIEQERQFDNFNRVFSSQAFLAVDNNFLLVCQPSSFKKIKVFARITPQNKALIIHNEKQLEKPVKSGKLNQLIMSQAPFSVGMVGDGANDLIAIRDADVGIGLTSSDAIYGATFSVPSLSHVIDLIVEAKNSERQVIEGTRYYGLVQFMTIPIVLILEQDCAFFTWQQLTTKLILMIPITITMNLSQPLPKLTKDISSLNFFTLRNQLSYWSIVVFGSLGLVLSYVYYENTQDFEPNVDHRYANVEEGWYGKTKSSTIMFIAANYIYILLNFIIYKGRPWKQPLYRNKLLTISLIFGLGLSIFVTFFTEKLSFVDIKPIKITNALVVVSIIIATCSIIALVDRLLWRKQRQQQMKGFDFYKNQSNQK